ncbi:amino acid transporter-like protein [Mollisia scopiformis]|uniref:Amino acid transporter-like protein n=1 Tax=Mollisia scopiformis TaxID=149040 RepID=A0A194X217_MOLSC|nr:amino acid transporter-like protein [Mollisia scopiformis]KUJ14245.1 amino acid transporter-like protein [Mollisia scopiformis]
MSALPVPEENDGTKIPSTNTVNRCVYPRDEAVLARFGKKQQLNRKFGLLSIVGLTCTLMITWEGTLTVFQLGLTNGGPSGLVYGFLFAWIGTALQALVMGEMASMIPLAGGAYNWVAILSPPWCSKFLSYLTGWITVIGWQAALASSALLGGVMIQGLLVLNYPTYVFERWHGTLLLYALIVIGLVINTWLARLLPRIEGLVLGIHVIGFFCTLIPLVYLGPHGSPSDVFAAFNDGGGWGSQGLSFMIGLSTSMFAFIGFDAASHMAEEIERADIVIPRSIIASVALNGSLGFGMVIATLFCIGDVDDALASATGFPFIQIFRNATNSNAGASAMTSMIIAAMVFATIGFLATASRMAWAFAREKGLPGYNTLVKVQTKSALPMYCIGLSTMISLLLALINIGSSTAFNALTSLVISAFYSSFVISASVLLHKRLTTPEHEMNYGPFRNRHFGIPIIIGSIVYSVIGIFFSFWPGSLNPTLVNMNWSAPVFSGVMVLSMGFWFIHGRRVYTGPIIEVDSREMSG